MILIIFIIILLIIIVSFFIIKYYIKDHGHFVSKYYMKHIIKISPFFSKMTITDLIARNIDSKEHYKNLYIKSLIHFTNNQKNIIDSLIKSIDPILINFKNISSIPWKITKIDVNIENGYPHTIEDVIVFNDNFFTLNQEQQKLLLLHEKIHIYQRKFPIETHEFIMNILGFQIKNRNKNFNMMVRNNPDLNDLTYGKDNYYILQIYNNFNPKSLADSKIIKVNEKNNEISNLTQNDLNIELNDKTQLEHPYEIMASYLPYVILHKKVNINYIDWMHQYL